jgi:nucleoside-triphosphatase THEP1
MTETTFAAAVYTCDLADREALSVFAAELRTAGVRVGGLVVRSDDGKMRRIDINRPTRETQENKTCSLNTSALMESTEALRRAIREGVDVIVLQKFGEQEQKGQGLNDEIFAAIVEEIPLLIAVPTFAPELWQERSGALGDTLPYDLDAFHHWWARVQHG